MACGERTKEQGVALGNLLYSIAIRRYDFSNLTVNHIALTLLLSFEPHYLAIKQKNMFQEVLCSQKKSLSLHKPIGVKCP